MEKKHNLKFAFSQISREWWCMVYSGGGGGRTHGRVTNFVEREKRNFVDKKKIDRFRVWVHLGIVAWCF